MAMVQMVLISEWLAYHVWIACPDWPNVDLDDALLRINTHTHTHLQEASRQLKAIVEHHKTLTVQKPGQCQIGNMTRTM